MFSRYVLVDLVDREFGLSTTRGNLGVNRTLRYSSSFVFMHTAFSMQTAGSVL